MTVTLELRPDLEALLRSQAARRGKPLEEYLVELVVRSSELENDTVASGPNAAPPAHDRTLEEKLAEIASSIPDEELAKLLGDLCNQLDHYVYGTPKH